jgi:hypothetical protein
MALEHVSESTKHAVDTVSVVTAVATLAQWLPAIAALFTIIWTGIRIYETPTIQRLIGNKVDNVTKD